jgi:arsenate reductase-like glutaredoxin family protein
MAPTELRRFTERLTSGALLDETSKAYRDSGIRYMRLNDSELFDRLLNDQRLLRLPLVRAGKNVAAGHDDSAWRALVASLG